MTRLKWALLIIVVLIVVPMAGMAIAYKIAPDAVMALFIAPPPAADPPRSPVKFSVESTEVQAFLDHPVARKWLDEYFPGFREAEQVNLSRRLTLPEAQQYFPELISEVSLAALAAMLEDTPPLEPIVVYSTSQTELGTLLDDPEATAIILKHMPGFTDDDRISMARPFTLLFLQAHIPDVVTNERCAAIDADFVILAERRAEEAMQ